MRTPTALLLSALLTGCRADSDAISSCDALRDKLETKVLESCRAEYGGGASQFCAICVSSGRYSYSVRPGAKCVCATLILQGPVCAGDWLDRQAILASIRAADRECSEFALFEDAGGDASGDGGSGDSLAEAGGD